MLLRALPGTLIGLMILSLTDDWLARCTFATSALAADVHVKDVAPRGGWKPAPVPLSKLAVPAAKSAEEVGAKKVASWPGSKKPVSLVCFDLLGELAMVALEDGTCHVIDPNTGKSFRQWQAPRRGKLLAAEITGDNQRFVMQYEGTQLFVCNVGDGKVVHSFDHGGDKLTALAVGTDPALVAVGTEGGVVWVWDIKTGELNDKINFGPRVTALTFYVDSQTLFVSGDAGPGINSYALPGGKLLASLLQPGNWPIRLACSVDGNMLFAISEDRVATTLLLRRVAGSNRQARERYGGAALVRGEPRNWFFLPSIATICSYLGGTDFEYCSVDLHSGVSGRHAGDRPTTGAVALSHNGRNAATALDDGGVDFYQMSGPYKSAARKNADLATQFRSLLSNESYEQLEELANKALADTTNDAAQSCPAQVFVATLDSPTDIRSSGSWDKYLAKLQGWLDAKPDSVAARVALGRSLTIYAWRLRRFSWSNQTPEQREQSALEKLTKAYDLLQAADEKGASAPVCANWMYAATLLGKPKEELVAIWERGTRHAPTFTHLHQIASFAMRPRSTTMAVKGDMAGLADRALQDLPGDVGAAAYALMAENYLVDFYPPYLVSAGFDLDRLNTSVQTTLRVYPESRNQLNVAAIVACLRADHATASRSVALLAGQANLDFWKSQEAIQRFREWAQSRDENLTSEIRFLPSWYPLQGTAFERDAAKVVTLSSTQGSELKLFDLTQPNPPESAGLPANVRPGFLSRHGRWIFCVPSATNGLALAVDRQTGNAVTWPTVIGPALTWISDDERQLARYADDKLHVFELINPSDQPSRIIPLPKRPTAVEFPSRSQTWRVVVRDDDGVRVISDEGKDLVEPLPKLRGLSAFHAVPGSSLVLASGPGMLGLLDVDSGQWSTLVDEWTDDELKRWYYTASAVSQDGALAPAATYHGLDLKQRKCELEIWDIKKKQKVHTLVAPKSSLRQVSFSGDAKKLAGAEAAGFVHIWNLEAIER